MKACDRYPLLFLAFWFLAGGNFSACNSPFTPKPRGYFQIPFPVKEYRTFDQAGYPYSFEYPVYAAVVKDSTFFGEATENPWWVNIDFPQFQGKIYLSYKEIGPTKFDKLLNDAFNLTNKHSQKAYSIDDSLMITPNRVTGMFFNVGGDVATSYQFFLTDSTKHFLRGALYFEATPNQDSLNPVNNFVAEDMRHLINSFRWKSPGSYLQSNKNGLINPVVRKEEKPLSK